MKTLERIQQDPRVLEAWSELGTDDGYWVMLKAGFADKGFDPWQPAHTIHEWTIRKVLERMRDVEPCSCKECAAALKKPCRAPS